MKEPKPVAPLVRDNDGKPVNVPGSGCCWTPEKCAGHSYCPRYPVCND